jgi:hypothetical protein
MNYTRKYTADPKSRSGDDQTMDVVLNDRQQAVLDWIANGCPDGVYEDEGSRSQRLR